MEKQFYITIGRWLVGSLIALLVVWGVTAFTMDSRAEVCFDESLGRVVFRPGSVRYYRSEGWAKTRYGLLGVPGIPDITRLKAPRVMIWGDSHVEAQEVNDEDKMAVIANQIWQERHIDKPLSFMSWGESGANFANHCIDMPRYERIVPNLTRHYIMMSFTRRAFPNDLRSSSALFIEKEGEYKVEEKQGSIPTPRGVALRQLISRCGLHLIYKVYAKLSPTVTAQLRFRVGPVKRLPPERELPSFNDTYTETSFTWLLQEMKRRTAHTISVVYIPEVPKIVSGKIVDNPCELDTEEASRLAVFKKVCQVQGIGLIDLTERFCTVARTRSVFPRGFPNTRPSEGHLNALGHRLVAEAIVADIEASLP